MTALGTVQRSRDAYVGGVCAGFAERFDFDPIVVRIFVALLTLATAGVAGIAYLVLWAVLPRSEARSATYDVRPEHAESSTFGSVCCVQDDVAPETISFAGRVGLALSLVALFVAVAVVVPPFVRGTRWWQFWPAALGIVGLSLLVLPSRSRHAAALHAAGVALTSLSAALSPMALGVVSWDSLGSALSVAWLLLVVGALLYIVGMVRGVSALMMAGAFCVVAFCVLALYVFGLPGEMEQLELMMPGGRAIVITAPFGL